MIKQNDTLNARQFMFVKDAGVLHSEASSLDGFRTAADIIDIHSPDTGRVVSFFLSYVARDPEGDIIGWEYKPVFPYDCPNVQLVSIYND
jgi:hypothetical protein